MRVPDAGAAFERAVTRLRSKSRYFDHFWRAQERFFEAHAGRLSAAVSYYAFFAALSLSLLLLSVLGYLLDLGALYTVVQQWLSENIPLIDANSIRLSRTTAGIVALVALIITGVNWVQAVRSSIRAVWLLEQQPGNPILRWLVDLAVLFLLGLVLLLTLALTAVGHITADWIETGLPWLNSVISWTGTVFGVFLNALLAAALLSGLPRLALPLRRVLPPALYVAIGLELLKSAGTWYISSVADKPAYQAVGSAVGLLLFLFVFNQMLLFASAWTATSLRGRAVDMAERKRIHTDQIHKVVG